MTVQIARVAKAALLSSFAFVATLQAADHLDAPALSGNGQLDINDLYAYQSPTDANNTVLVMTVNPLAGLLSPQVFGSSTAPGAGVEYEFLIDTTGNAMPDLTFNARFTNTGAGQVMTLTRNGVPIATGGTGATLPVVGGGLVHAGVFDDPFFFDLNGFNNSFNFTGDDFFAGADISAIVLEVPSSTFGANNIGVWARTLEDGTQVDRMGRPAINTALIPSGSKDAFNQGIPSNDPADFGAAVEAAITDLSNAANAAALTPVLLPDILTFDTTDASGFLNGRQLADDVIDAELSLLTASTLGDGVDANDQPFQNVFPYLALANNAVLVPAPGALLLVLLGLGGLFVRRRWNR